jgi:hypothetical protein
MATLDNVDWINQTEDEIMNMLDNQRTTTFIKTLTTESKPRLPCTYAGCYKSFPTKKGLDSHIAEHKYDEHIASLPDEVIKCKHCEQKFVRKSGTKDQQLNIDRHMEKCERMHRVKCMKDVETINKLLAGLPEEYKKLIIN